MDQIIFAWQETSCVWVEWNPHTPLPHSVRYTGKVGETLVVMWRDVFAPWLKTNIAGVWRCKLQNAAMGTYYCYPILDFDFENEDEAMLARLKFG